jgi:hypothetical protein
MLDLRLARYQRGASNQEVRLSLYSNQTVFVVLHLVESARLGEKPKPRGKVRIHKGERYAISQAGDFGSGSGSEHTNIRTNMLPERLLTGFQPVCL